MRNIFFAVLLCVGAVWAGPDTRPAAADGADNQPPKTVERVYDIRDYLLDMGDYPLHQSQPKPPTTRPFHAIPVPGAGSGYNPVDCILDTNLTDHTKHRIDDLMTLIMENVDADSWRITGGSVGQIMELNGKLFITQTPDAQAEVQKLIAEVTAGANRTVHISATWLELTDAEFAAMREPAANGQDGAIICLNDAALKKAAPIARSQLLCLDGQTVHITAGPQPMPIALQVQPRLASSDKEIVVDVLNSVVDRQEFHTTARIPLGADVVIGGITIDRSGKDDSKQLYFVMRIDAAGKVP